MKRRIVILSDAEDDLDAGQQFYEEQSAGLGEYFLDALAADFESLLLCAGSHRVVNGFHRCLSRKFPHAIFYKIRGDIVSVYAVLDCRRHPDELAKALRDR